MDELLDLAVAAARAAAEILVAGQGQARHVETKSSATDMVSEMDRAAEEAVRKVILGQRPDDEILGEEGGASAGATGVRWIVDPLDGTTNYLYGFPAWAVSVAAEIDGTVTTGAILDPSRDELWTGTLAGGAFLNGAALELRVDGVSLDKALVATGFSYQATTRSSQGERIAKVLPLIRDIRRAGAAALDMCWAAAGRVDAYFEQGTHIWDRAAGALVATEAGLWVGDYHGGPPSDDGVLAAPPTLAAALRVCLAP